MDEHVDSWFGGRAARSACRRAYRDHKTEGELKIRDWRLVGEVI